MKKILSKLNNISRNLFALSIMVFPFMALKGGGQEMLTTDNKDITIEEFNDRLRSEITAINDTISAIEIQIRYKDSIDQINSK